MSKEVNFGKIAKRFETNISTIGIFVNQIGSLAEEHDKNVTEQHNNSFAELVGLSAEELKILESISKESLETALKIEMATSERTVEEEQTLAQFTVEQKAVIQKMSQIDGKKFLLKSRNFFRSSTKILPVQAFVLRRSALITLASHFEYLIAELIHSFYLLHPQALPSEERVLSLTELREIGSIEEAENHLIEREVDSLLRDSVEKQLDYFSSKRIRVNLDQLTEYKNSIIEIFQRRNIFVHNDGVVNKIYLARVPKELLEEGAKDGTRLGIKEEYLNKAIVDIFISGIVLSQICWRKWQKEKIEVADSVYINLLYESLQEHNYDFLNSLQNFSSSLEYASDRNKRVVIINHAIALRELGQIEKMKKLLETLDWSSSSLEFRAALFALRKEEKNLFEILPKAIAAKELQRQSLIEWPLFKPFHESKEFIQLIENCPEDDVIV